MSSPSEIQFNYQKAIEQANVLDVVASQLKGPTHMNLESVIQCISSAWRSDSTPQYLSKTEKVDRDMITVANHLRRIADTIRAIAEQVRQADLEAWRIANERK